MSLAWETEELAGGAGDAPQTWLIAVPGGKIKVAMHQAENGQTTIAWLVTADAELSIDELNEIARLGCEVIVGCLEDRGPAG